MLVSSKPRDSYYGKLYLINQSEKRLPTTIFNIKNEVEFNILTKVVLPFKITEKIPENFDKNDILILLQDLRFSGIVLNIEEMLVIDLL